MRHKMVDMQRLYDRTKVTHPFRGDLGRLLDWKMGSPRHLRSMGAQPEEATIQRQFTLECRVDYADNDKNATMRQAMIQAAAHVNAAAMLLSDGVKPQTVVFSDDFFCGHEEIKWMEDIIQKGLDETNMNETQGETKGEISPGLMSAMKDL